MKNTKFILIGLEKDLLREAPLLMLKCDRIMRLKFIKTVLASYILVKSIGTNLIV